MAKGRKKARKPAKRSAKKRKTAVKSKARRSAKAKSRAKRKRAKAPKESFVEAVAGGVSEAAALRSRLVGHNTFED